MVLGGLGAVLLGVNAERRSLEDIAHPISSVNSLSPHLSNVTGAPRPPAARSTA